MFAFLILPVRRYFRIRNKQKNRIDKWSVFFGFVISFSAFSPNFQISGENGLTSEMGAFLAALAGFFITALAAIATFPGTKDYSLEMPLRGEGVFLGEDCLSRRQFYCILFGYLSEISIILVLLCSFLPLFIKIIPSSFLIPCFVFIGRFLFLCMVLPFFCHMLATFMLGLVFLSVRMHENSHDYKITRKK
ncbi:hypothetical protein NQF87_00060 [Bombella sp. TMW 2.2559]|uniref:Uncharacterized protein n=1 Tax=Bombella dulcis TaxID=2967339 RepID=A0ABT3W9T1_9PROT|nr:hypothetical protein [Bombella dulcis]MCX5615378.1 hypothetical protein [Bombella dulcis]